MHQIQILILLVFGNILGSLKSRYILIQLQDKSITHRNQDNGFLDRIGEIKSRDNDQDGVPPVKWVCPSSCKCKSGQVDNGGHAVDKRGNCNFWCSKYGYCGETEDHKNDGVDCRGCADCDDEDIQTKYRCGMNCEWMNRDGWCSYGYNVTYPRCALRNVTNHCPKSCGECGRIPDPDAKKAAIEYFGEYRWIKVPESLINYWEKFTDPNIGTCVNNDNLLTNNQWALICKEVYWRIRIDLGKIDGFYINVTRTEIKANIPGIPPKLVNDLNCQSDTYLMTCAFNWDHAFDQLEARLRRPKTLSAAMAYCPYVGKRDQVWTKEQAKAEIEKFLTEFVFDFGPNFLQSFFMTQGRDRAESLGGIEKVALALSESKTIDEFGTDQHLTAPLEPTALEHFRSVLNAIKEYDVGILRPDFNDEQIGDVVELFENPYFETFLHYL